MFFGRPSKKNLWTSLEFSWKLKNVLKLLNRAQKKLSAIAAWENSKIASVEANLRKIEVIDSFLG